MSRSVYNTVESFLGGLCSSSGKRTTRSQLCEKHLPRAQCSVTSTDDDCSKPSSEISEGLRAAVGMAFSVGRVECIGGIVSLIPSDVRVSGDADPSGDASLLLPLMVVHAEQLAIPSFSPPPPSDLDLLRRGQYPVRLFDLNDLLQELVRAHGMSDRVVVPAVEAGFSTSAWADMRSPPIPYAVYQKPASLVEVRFFKYWYYSGRLVKLNRFRQAPPSVVTVASLDVNSAMNFFRAVSALSPGSFSGSYRYARLALNPGEYPSLHAYYDGAYRRSIEDLISANKAQFDRCLRVSIDDCAEPIINELAEPCSFPDAATFDQAADNERLALLAPLPSVDPDDLQSIAHECCRSSNGSSSESASEWEFDPEGFEFNIRRRVPKCGFSLCRHGHDECTRDSSQYHQDTAFAEFVRVRGTRFDEIRDDCMLADEDTRNVFRDNSLSSWRQTLVNFILTCDMTAHAMGCPHNSRNGKYIFDVGTSSWMRNKPGARLHPQVVRLCPTEEEDYVLDDEEWGGPNYTSYEFRDARFDDDFSEDQADDLSYIVHECAGDDISDSGEEAFIFDLEATQNAAAPVAAPVTTRPLNLEDFGYVPIPAPAAQPQAAPTVVYMPHTTCGPFPLVEWTNAHHLPSHETESFAVLHDTNLVITCNIRRYNDLLSLARARRCVAPGVYTVEQFSCFPRSTSRWLSFSATTKSAVICGLAPLNAIVGCSRACWSKLIMLLRALFLRVRGTVLSHHQQAFLNGDYLGAIGHKLAPRIRASVQRVLDRACTTKGTLNYIAHCIAGMCGYVINGFITDHIAMFVAVVKVLAKRFVADPLVRFCIDQAANIVCDLGNFGCVPPQLIYRGNRTLAFLGATFRAYVGEEDFPEALFLMRSHLYQTQESIRVFYKNPTWFAQTALDSGLIPSLNDGLISLDQAMCASAVRSIPFDVRVVCRFVPLILALVGSPAPTVTHETTGLVANVSAARALPALQHEALDLKLKMSDLTEGLPFTGTSTATLFLSAFPSARTQVVPPTSKLHKLAVALDACVRIPKKRSTKGTPLTPAYVRLRVEDTLKLFLGYTPCFVWPWFDEYVVSNSALGSISHERRKKRGGQRVVLKVPAIGGDAHPSGAADTREDTVEVNVGHHPNGDYSEDDEYTPEVSVIDGDFVAGAKSRRERNEDERQMADAVVSDWIDEGRDTFRHVFGDSGESTPEHEAFVSGVDPFPVCAVGSVLDYVPGIGGSHKCCYVRAHEAILVPLDYFVCHIPAELKLPADISSFLRKLIDNSILMLSSDGKKDAVHRVCVTPGSYRLYTIRAGKPTTLGLAIFGVVLISLGENNSKYLGLPQHVTNGIKGFSEVKLRTQVDAIGAPELAQLVTSHPVTGYKATTVKISSMDASFPTHNGNTTKGYCGSPVTIGKVIVGIHVGGGAASEKVNYWVSLPQRSSDAKSADQHKVATITSGKPAALAASVGDKSE